MNILQNEIMKQFFPLLHQVFIGEGVNAVPAPPGWHDKGCEGSAASSLL